jgi:hypothetical protein
MSTPPVAPECPICLQPEADMCLPCGGYHWLHRACWADVVDQKICPVCRQAVVPETIRLPAPVTHNYSYVTEIINRIRTVESMTPSLEHISWLILTGKSLTRANLDYVNREYARIFDDQSVRNDHVRAMSSVDRLMTEIMSHHRELQSFQNSFSSMSISSTPRSQSAAPSLRSSGWSLSMPNRDHTPVRTRYCERCYTTKEREDFPTSRKVCISCIDNRKCMRCKKYLPPSAYDARKRICRPCKELREFLSS